MVATLIGVVALVSEPRRLPPDNLRNAPAIREERQVTLTPSTRRAINALLAEFVPAAVGRRDPERAWELAGRGLRAGTTRRDWLAGDMPVHPYPFADRSFRKWRTAYAYRDRVAIDLLLHPRPTARVGPIVFGIDLVRRDGRWLVDSFFPAAVLSPPEGPAEQPRQAVPTPETDEARLDPIWLLVPGLVFGSALLATLVLGVRALLGRLRRGAPAPLPPSPTSVTRRRPSGPA